MSDAYNQLINMIEVVARSLGKECRKSFCQEVGQEVWLTMPPFWWMIYLNIPPAEYEMMYYQQLEESTKVV